MMVRTSTAATVDGGVLVTFRLPSDVDADKVSVVGDFNEWSTTADPLERDEHGWVLTLTLPPGRPYRFRYLLDGERWENDWAADDYVPNEFGGDDSVVDLTEVSEGSAASAEPPPAEQPKPPRARKRAAPKAKGKGDKAVGGG